MDLWEFEISLVYILNFETAKATEWNLVSRQTNKQTKNQGVTNDVNKVVWKFRGVFREKINRRMGKGDSRVSF